MSPAHIDAAVCDLAVFAFGDILSYEADDWEITVCTWHPEHNYQGWVDTMHGGILSTLIDEVCGWVVTRKLQTNLLIACSMMIIQMLSSEYRKN